MCRAGVSLEDGMSGADKTAQERWAEDQLTQTLWPLGYDTEFFFFKDHSGFCLESILPGEIVYIS